MAAGFTRKMCRHRVQHDPGELLRRAMYAWMAACNLEAELSHDTEARQFFRLRQRQVERDLKDLER